MSLIDGVSRTRPGVECYAVNGVAVGSAIIIGACVVVGNIGPFALRIFIES